MTSNECYKPAMANDSIVYIHVARDYKNMIDTLTNNLEHVKKELCEMRRQDIKLLRQLIRINDIIHLLSHKLKIKNTSYLETDFNDMEIKTQLRVVRQHSVPHYCNCDKTTMLTGSRESSFEEIKECTENDSELSEKVKVIKQDSIPEVEWSNTGINRSKQYRPRSHSHQITRSDSDKHDDSHIADLLERNIKLWKQYDYIK